MIGYYGSKSGCFLVKPCETIPGSTGWRGAWQRGQPRWIPWMVAIQRSRSRWRGHKRSVEYVECRCLLPLRKSFSQMMMMMMMIIIIIFFAQSMLLLMCCKLRIVQELVQLPALRACLLEALRHGTVQIQKPAASVKGRRCLLYEFLSLMLQILETV